MNATSVLCYEERTLLVPNISPTVFVVDDDISVRESLEFLIRDEGWQVETFTSAEEFVKRPREFVPSCLILDISMPGLNGLDLQKRLAVERPDMPIIFLTGHGDIPKTVQAIKAGAVEFLTKPFSDSTLLSAIRGAIDRSKALIVRDAEFRALKSRYARLTSREREVLALVVVGKANKEVANVLGISEVTVKAHRGKMMQKMGAGSLAELVNQATRLRLPRSNRRP
jgi:FixJ family two-component response regulator